MNKSFALIFFIYLFCECSSNHHNLNEEMFRNYPNLYLKSITFYQDGYLLDTISTNINLKTNRTPKIVTILDGACDMCLEEIKHLDSIFAKDFSKLEIANIVIIVGGNINNANDSYMDKNYVTTIIVDNFGQFFETNNLSRFGKITFVLNDKNEIIIIGNPFKDSTIKKQLIKAITA